MRFLPSHRYQVLYLEYANRAFQIKNEQGEVIESKKFLERPDNKEIDVEFLLRRVRR